MLVDERGRFGNGCLPVNIALPDGVVPAVEHVQKHRPDIARGRPVGGLKILGRDSFARVFLLPLVAPAPDNHSQGEHKAKSSLGAHTATESLEVKQWSDDDGGDDLRKPVQESVERLGAGAEVRAVDGVLLVGVEPVGGPEHGEQQDDVRLGADSCPQADDLGLPAGVLLEDDTRPVPPDDLVRVA